MRSTSRSCTTSGVTLVVTMASARPSALASFTTTTTNGVIHRRSCVSSTSSRATATRSGIVDAPPPEVVEAARYQASRFHDRSFPRSSIQGAFSDVAQRQGRGGGFGSSCHRGREGQTRRGPLRRRVPCVEWAPTSQAESSGSSCETPSGWPCAPHAWPAPSHRA